MTAYGIVTHPQLLLENCHPLYRVMVLSDSLGQRQELNELPARRAETIIHLSLNLKAMARRNSEEILNKTSEK